MIDKIMNLAITYNGNDVKQIMHLLKVHSFARCIGILESCDTKLQTIIEVSALLHDIGIRESERKYNSRAGNWQEIEGPIVAKELFEGLNLDNFIQDRVLFLIGNHHSYKKIDGIDFQILVEADFLVNIYENQMPKKSINSLKTTIFKTENGIKLLEQLYL
jgi:hypothetical protein